MNILVHLGQPKAWSTTIQTAFESIDGNLNYLGFNPSFTESSWYKNNLAEIFEFGLRLETNQSFEKKLNFYRDLLYESLDSEKLNVISSESLSFKFFAYEIDTEIKLKRLGMLLRSFNTEFLYIWRRPSSLIKSCFKDLVKLGLNEDFEDFFENIFLYKDANFYNDLKKDSIVNLVKKFFNSSKLSIIKLQDSLELNKNEIIDFIRNRTGNKVVLQSKNRSFCDKATESIRHYNLEESSQVCYYNLIEPHRYFPHLSKDTNSFIWNNARSRKKRKHFSDLYIDKILDDVYSTKKVILLNRLIDQECRFN